MKKAFATFILCLLLIINIGSIVAETAENDGDINIEVVTVTNETEFMNAIDSNRIIQLSPGIYNLSLLDYPEKEVMNWEQKQLNISDVENLSIVGLGDQPVRIVTENPYAYVIVFINANNIAIRNVEAGHDLKKGSCIGGVLAFENCRNITIEDSILYGSGIEGLTLTEVESFKFFNSVISDCTYGIITCYNSKNLEFSQSIFTKNREFDLFNFIKSTNILFSNCEISKNETVEGSQLYTGYGLFNLSKVTDLRIKDSRILSNTAEYLICADDKEVLTLENTAFKDNTFISGGYFFPVEGLYFNLNKVSTVSRDLEAVYKKLEYISRKLNDPVKLDKPKSRKLFGSYWRQAVSELEVLIKEGTDWEKESLLGRFCQVGLQIDEKGAWERAEAHLKNAIKLKADLPGVNHLALGVLYCARIFSITVSEKDSNSKFTIQLKSRDPKLISLAEKELLLDNRFPGTSNIYLFLVYYFQGKFEAAVKQADRYLMIYPDDELVRKLRGMAKSRIGNKKGPSELNVYIEREKTKQLFDYYFLQGAASIKRQTESEPTELSQESDPYQQRLQEVIYQGLEFTLGNTKDEMIKNIGTPFKIDAQKVENRHEEGVIDTIYELTFDGLYVGIYDAHGKELMIYQKITSPKYKIKYDLNIGTSREHVKEILGKPAVERQNQLKYTFETEVGDEILLFGLKDNQVIEVEWNFVID